MVVNSLSTIINYTVKTVGHLFVIVINCIISIEVIIQSIFLLQVSIIVFVAIVLCIKQIHGVVSLNNMFSTECMIITEWTWLILYRVVKKLLFCQQYLWRYHSNNVVADYTFVLIETYVIIIVSK